MASADLPKYRIILSGAVLPEKSRAEVIDKLALLFNSQRDTMADLLRGKPTALKKNYRRDEGEKIRQAIRDAGAACTMTLWEAEEVAAEAVIPVADAEADVGAAASAEGHSEDAAEDAATEQTQPAWARFVAVNTDYYGRQFAKFSASDANGERVAFALSWHWPAFFAFFFWAVYRKLWLWAGVNLAGSVLLALAFKPGFIYLAWSLFWPLAANYLYFLHVRRRVAAVGVDAGGNDAGRVHGGGVSRAAVGLGMMIIAVFSVILENTATERLQMRLGSHSVDILPDAWLRGDGSVIEDLAALDIETANTVAIMNVLAVALKLSASEQEIARRQVKDAWGNTITVRREVGRLALVSAGPDGQFDNDDDILQYLPLTRL